jgi:hypothetical protein
MNISNIFNTLNKESVICEEQQISNQLKNTYIRKKRKLKQTNLEIYFDKKKKNNLYKKILYSNNKMSFEGKPPCLLNIEFEDNSKINGAFVIKNNKHNKYEFTPITNNIKINNNKIYKCIYDKENDIMHIDFGIKTISQKIKECRGYLRNITL